MEHAKNDSWSATTDVPRCIAQSVIPSLVLRGDNDEDRSPASIVYANNAAQSLWPSHQSNAPSRWSLFELVDHESVERLQRIFDRSTNTPGQLAHADPIIMSVNVSRTDVTGSACPTETMTVHLSPLDDEGRLVAQLTRCEGWLAVERVLDEQQRFRSALLELSELAHSTENDDEFYQHLLERAVEVVPGAQGGSVQLVVPGTTTFRFTAAVGFDLEGLQQHVLDREHFFRDTSDPVAQIVRNFGASTRSDEISEWLETVGRLSEIVVNVSAPVITGGLPVAFLSMDNFEDPEAMTETSVEMTTVLGRLIGDLWRRRELESELRTEREAYRHLAMHDALTGLANRRHLQQSIDQMLSKTFGAGHPAAVLFVDIDDFKGVNDRLGHEKGDALLIAVAHGLRAAARTGDEVGRWGGDEFLVLPNRVESSEEAVGLAERLMAHFVDPIDLGDGLSIRARLTVGVGWAPESNVDADTLVRTADEALYAAKAAGKGIVRVQSV